MHVLNRRKTPPNRLDVMARVFQPFVSDSHDGLEIGPYDRPFFKREVYPNIKYADVFTTEELRKHASANPKRDSTQVQTVDYVTANKSLSDVIPESSLDFVFCSHVLEHVPDLIKSLQDIEQILKPGGKLLCAYPDRNYTFDIDRDPTNFQTLIDRNERKIWKPDPETVYDYFLKYRQVFVGRLWRKLPDSRGPLRYTEAEAKQQSIAAATEYVDVHCNLFTSKEFETIAGNLQKHGKIGLKLNKIIPTRAPLNEFFFVLEKQA